MSFLSFLTVPPGPARRPGPGGSPRVNGERAQDPGSIPDLSYFEAVRSSPNRAEVPLGPYLMPEKYKRHRLYAETVQRLRLSALSRYALDNYPPAALALSLIANHAAPILPRPATDSSGWNRRAEDAFDAWAENCSFDGVAGFYELSRTICYALDLDGDIGISAEDVDGELRLRLWPSELVGAGILNQVRPLENEWDGVLFDRAGRVVGYRVFDPFTGAPVSYDLNQFLLLYEPEAPGRYRGFSALRRGLNDLRDAQETKGFVKLGAKIRSALAAVIENGSLAESDWRDPEAPPVSTGTPPRALTVAQLLGGEVPVISGSFKTISSGGTGNDMEFIAQLGGWFVAGLGLPPAYFLDERLTGPNQRSVIGKAQRRFDVRMRVMARLASWLWRRFVAVEIGRARLTAEPGWERVRFQMPPRATIDLDSVERSSREAHGMRLRSRKSYHEQTGDNWSDELAQCIAEDLEAIRRLREAAREAGLPEETFLKRYGYEVSSPAPAAAGAVAPAPSAAAGARARDELRGGVSPVGEVGGAGTVWLGRPDQRRDEKGRFAHEGRGRRKRGRRGRPKKAAAPPGDRTAASLKKSERARRAHKGNTPFKSALSDQAAVFVARAIQGVHPTTENKPYDAVSDTVGIEVKGLFQNKNAKLTMHPPDFHDPMGSLNRKILDAQKNPGRLSVTVAFISPQPDGEREEAFRIPAGKLRWFVKAGVGSFRLSSMEELGSLEELPRWIEAHRARLEQETARLRKRQIVLWGGLRRGRELTGYLRQLEEWTARVERGVATKKELLAWKNRVLAEQERRGRVRRTPEGYKANFDWDGKPVKKGKRG